MLATACCSLTPAWGYEVRPLLGMGGDGKYLSASIPAVFGDMEQLDSVRHYMYNGHMKRYSVAEARARFSNLLDAAEQGELPIIERRGVRFTLRPESRAPRRTRGRGVIAHVDPVVLDGQWTWAWTLNGLRFAGRRRRR